MSRERYCHPGPGWVCVQMHVQGERAREGGWFGWGGECRRRALTALGRRPAKSHRWVLRLSRLRECESKGGGAGGGLIKRRGPQTRRRCMRAPEPRGFREGSAPATGPGIHRPTPARVRLTFQQPLDDAVDVEFIDIRHRRPAADPPAAALPPARARVSHVLLPHATSPTSGGGGGGGSSSRGGSPPQPPRSRLPPPLATGTTRRTKWPPTRQASLGRRTDARAGVQRPGRDFFTGP